MDRAYLLATGLLVLVACGPTAAPSGALLHGDVADDRKSGRANGADDGDVEPVVVENEEQLHGIQVDSSPGAGPEPKACTEGATRCGATDGSSPKEIHECGDTGAWTKRETCEHGCEIGSGGEARCKPTPLAECCAILRAQREPDDENFCDVAPGTAACPMTEPGGYCDPNGDGSYTDGDWEKGWYGARDLCS